MESNLDDRSYELKTETITERIEASLVQDLLNADVTSIQSIEAAILITKEHYFYQRRISTHPLQYTYKCVSPDTLRLAFDNRTIDSGWIPQGIVRCGQSLAGNWVVLFIPPQRHTLTLLDHGTLQIPLPGIVFIGLQTTYWTVAIAEPAFTPQSIAYHVPLPNVYSNLKICWGDQSPPAASTQAIAQAWFMFITSHFTSHLVHSKSRQHSDNIQRQLMALHQRKAKKYPCKDLVPIQGYPPATIEKLVRDLITHE